MEEKEKVKTSQWNNFEKYVNNLQHKLNKEEDEIRVQQLQEKLVDSKANILLSIKDFIQEENFHEKHLDIDEEDMIILDNEDGLALYDELEQTQLFNHDPRATESKFLEKENRNRKNVKLGMLIDPVYQDVTRKSIEPLLEDKFGPMTYGFRNHPTAQDTIKKIKEDLETEELEWVVTGEFDSFFKNIDINFLINKFKDSLLKDELKKWLKKGILEQYGSKKTILAPLLADIVLNGMDQAIGISYNEFSYIDYEDKEHIYYEPQGIYRLILYTDKFIILSPTKEDAQQVTHLLEPFLKERGLKLKNIKIDDIYHGFDFLGFHLQVEETYPISFDKLSIKITPSDTSIREIEEKILEICDDYRNTRAVLLLNALKPFIKGIIQYYQPLCSKESLSYLDEYITEMLREYLIDLHPKKEWDWIVAEYFKTDLKGQSESEWVFTDTKSNQQLEKII